MLLLPFSGPPTGAQPQPSACRGCHPSAQAALRWTAPLSGTWIVGAADGAAGTVPVTGQAYAAVGDGLAVLGNGLTLSAYALADGAPRWQVTLAAPPGAAIESVRVWPGVVTAGIVSASGRLRTEAVLRAADGLSIRRYPAAVFGGTVAASAATAVIVGPRGVTSYDNASGRRRWYRATGADQSWRTDGQSLFVAQSAGGYLAPSPVTALKIINLQSGAERTLGSPLDQPFSGTLALAVDGAALFASAAGVTAYSGSTGDELWSVPAAVPEGTDPVADLVYLTTAAASAAGATLTGVDPRTGAVRATVPATAAGGAAGLYAVRGGVALGLDSGAAGTAWGYSVTAGRVVWTSAALPWPHYFADLSGLGGSAAATGDQVVLAACPKLATAPPTAASEPAGPAAAAVAICADPELVAFSL